MGRGPRLRGSPTQRQLKTFVNKKKLRSGRGRPVGVLSTKRNKERESREEPSKGKLFKTQKTEKALLPAPERRRSQTLCRGWEQVAVEEQGPRTPPVFPLLSGGPPTCRILAPGHCIQALLQL